jgi:hypothetical protein
MGLIGVEDKYHTNGSFAIAQRWVHNLKVSSLGSEHSLLAENLTLHNAPRHSLR